MSKSSQVVPAKHYSCGHDAVPTYAFDEAEKSSAFDPGVDRVADSGRLQKYLLRSDKTGDCGGWSAFDTGRLLYEEGGNCQQSFNQHFNQFQYQFQHQFQFNESENENDDDEDRRALEAMAMAMEVAERSVSPSYLDFLMCDDSDASYYGTSGSSDDSGADDNDNYYDFDLDPAALVASMDPSSPYHHLNTGFSNDNEHEILQSLVEFDDALKMLNLPNAGGSSLLSEVLSCEMLYRCLGARLAKTEMEIRYFFAYQPMTDYTISLPGLASGFHVGVSVTRAFAYKGAYRRSECRKLLKKKLSGITASTRNVMDERLFKQILHVWVPNGKVARTVQATYRTLPTELTRNSVVVISVVNAAWVFNNRR
ncbi:hypothetical protein BGZ95_006904 [Linnemannia exigua]|uniref:Uncharacterized protein n=1 Tax=Linnemannia exigua TaxID=604196 RepID=A0AAD4H845_9FUNG|nr:hypothetical protein BGZ95_006904 [Linnemannia exigua]